MKIIIMSQFVGCPSIAANGFRLDEVAEHKTSLVVQTFKLR